MAESANRILHIIRVRSGFLCSSRRRHTRFDCDWSSDVCSSDLKSYQINRTDDPEPLFELELTRAHGRICSGGCRQLQSCSQRFGGEQVAPFQSDETTNRLPSLSLNIAYVPQGCFCGGPSNSTPRCFNSS